MKNSYLFLVLITYVFCSNSGIKLSLDTEVFKVLSQINFNKILANKTLVNHTEISGKMMFKYDLVLDNLTMVDIQPPKIFALNHTNRDDGTPLIKLNAQNLEATIATDFVLKYGPFKDQARQSKVRVVVESIRGEFFFTSTGDVIISTFEVALGKLEIEFKSGFVKFIYSLVKGLILKTIEKQLKTLNDLISTSINKWVSEKFLYDLGFGIGFNLTNIDRPTLMPYTKEINLGFFASLFNFLKSLIQEDSIENSFLNTTILTCGIHGSVYPNLSPELQPQIPEAVEMDYNHKLFKNEVNLLLSDFSLNTLLFMAQQTGYLHKEFTEELNTIFPFEFNVKGVATQIPEFLNKYPTDNFPVQMKAYIAPKKWKQPQLVSTQDETDLVLNFGIDFDTTFSDDPFDDPSKDLQLNVTLVCKIHFFANNNVLNIKITQAEVTNIMKEIDELNADEANLKKLIEDSMNNLILPMLNEYVQDLKVVDLLNNATGLSFRNFKLNSLSGYHAISIGINGLN